MRTLIGLAALLWLAPGIGLALAVMLTLAHQQFSDWSAGLPWVFPTIAGLLACAALAFPAARHCGVSWSALADPANRGGVMLAIGLFMWPFAIGSARVAVEAEPQGLHRGFEHLTDALMPIGSIGMALFGAAVLAFTPLYQACSRRAQPEPAPAPSSTGASR